MYHGIPMQSYVKVDVDMYVLMHISYIHVDM